MCDEQLAKKIVSELLRYLIKADYEVRCSLRARALCNSATRAQIREELVVKIAILAERFATVYSWCVGDCLLIGAC